MYLKPMSTVIAPPGMGKTFYAKTEAGRRFVLDTDFLLKALNNESAKDGKREEWVLSGTVELVDQAVKLREHPTQIVTNLHRTFDAEVTVMILPENVDAYITRVRQERTDLEGFSDSVLSEWVDNYLDFAERESIDVLRTDEYLSEAVATLGPRFQPGHKEGFSLKKPIAGEQCMKDKERKKKLIIHGNDLLAQHAPAFLAKQGLVDPVEAGSPAERFYAAVEFLDDKKRDAVPHWKEESAEAVQAMNEFIANPDIETCLHAIEEHGDAIFTACRVMTQLGYVVTPRDVFELNNAKLGFRKKAKTEEEVLAHQAELERAQQWTENQDKYMSSEG